MRLNPNPYPDLLNSVAQLQQQINTDNLQIASGKGINVPSDNPAGAAILTQTADQMAGVDQFQRSVESIQSEMQIADGAVNSVLTSLQQAVSLGLEGSGSIAPGPRAILATEVQGIQSQLVSLANLTYQGNSVFAGTATQTSAYVLDPNSPSGVTYQGNTGVNHITLGSNLNLQTNLPGSTLFSSPGADMFQSIKDLINGLESGNGIPAAVTALGSITNAVTAQRVFYGKALAQLTAQVTALNTQTSQLTQQAASVGGVNLTSVITNLTSSETSLQATLTVIGQTAHINLFSFLK